MDFRQIDEEEKHEHRGGIEASIGCPLAEGGVVAPICQV